MLDQRILTRIGASSKTRYFLTELLHNDFWLDEPIDDIDKDILKPPTHNNLEWMKSALCAQTDPEAFFPKIGESNKPAKRVCAKCTVQKECLNYALSYSTIGLYGIWGGLSQRERAALKNK